MSTILERVKRELAMDRSGGEHEGLCFVADSDVKALIAVAEAAIARHNEWTRETYIAIDDALKALTTPEPRG